MAKHAGKENVQCSVHFQADEDSEGSLLDSGANGGMAGGDVLIVEECDVAVNVLGVSAQEIRDLKLAVAAGHVETNEGPVIAIMS